jgi:hypothetical protein
LNGSEASSDTISNASEIEKANRQAKRICEQDSKLSAVQEAWILASIPIPDEGPVRPPIDAMDFAYAMVTSGLDATSAGSMVNGIGFEVPSHNEIFKKLKLICEKIIEMAKKEWMRKSLRSFLLSYNSVIPLRFPLKDLLSEVCSQKVELFEDLLLYYIILKF